MPVLAAARRWGPCLTLLFAVGAGPLAAQAPDHPRVDWWPDHPTQGTLIRIRVSGPEDAVAVLGSLAGEALHFALDSNGTRSSLGGLPVDAPSSLPLIIVLQTATRRDTITVPLRVDPGAFTSERLRVAPEFGHPPDNATAARIARDNARAREVSRRAHDTPLLWREPFLRPRDSRITGRFGHIRSFNGRVQSRHNGLDFAGEDGAPVQAAARGVVALVQDFYLAGKVVYLDHGAGLVTAYFHLSRADVAQGDTVEAGQELGAVGHSGRVTGPHLHWVVRYGRINVDPLSLLGLNPGQDTLAPPPPVR
ncbi:MAG: M23 family metallopeptidase [Gemmatimonadales bacterium]